MKKHISILVVLLAFYSTARALTVQDLGIPGEYSSAWGVNNTGQVVGGYTLNGQNRYFLWSNGIFTDLGNFTAVAINDSGVMAGYFHDAQGLEPKAAIMYDNLHSGLLPLPCEAWALGISNSGYVTGHGCNGQAFRYNIGSKIMEFIGSPFARGTVVGYGQSVNDSGQVGGYFHYAGVDRPFSFTSSVTILNTPTILGVNSINNSGVMTGWGNDYRPFLFDGVKLDFPALPIGLPYGGFNSVNENGDAAGWGRTATGQLRGIAYWNGVITDLSSFGVTYTDQINNLGQIAGTALLKGQQKAVLILP